MKLKYWMYVCIMVVVVVCAVGIKFYNQALAQTVGKYYLPWPGGFTYQVTQDQNVDPQGSHWCPGLYCFALDFGMNPEGKPVWAAYAGTVSHVVKGNTACGGQDQAANANLVVIDHYGVNGKLLLIRVLNCA